MKKKPLLTDEERAAVNRAVAEVEDISEVEVVPAVAAASGRYDRAEDVVGLWTGILLAAGVWWLSQRVGEGDGWSAAPQVRLGFWVFALVLVAGFVAGAIAAGRFKWLRRLFTAAIEMDQETTARAKAVFFDSRVRRTAPTGAPPSATVLIYVSLFERRVAVVADDAVRARFSDERLTEVGDELTLGIREAGVAAGLRRGIERLGKLLAVALPAAPGRLDPVHSEVVLLE